MTPYLFFFLISFFGLAYGTYTDFKERVVSNWVTYGMLCLGIAGYAIWAFLAQDWAILGWSVATTIGTFFVSYALYKAGVWAGGDVKLFTGLAALNPVNPAILARQGIMTIPALQPIALPVFPLTLFMFSLFAMLPYGAALAGARLLKNRKEKEKFKKDFSKRLAEILEIAALAVGFAAILSFYGTTLWLALPLLFVAALLPKKARLCIAGIAIIAALWLGAKPAAEEFLALAALMLGTWLLLKLYSLSKVLMRKPVPVEELEEGMISGQTIVKNGKKVEIAEEAGIKKLINLFAAHRFGRAMELMKPKGKEIVSSRSASGLTKEEISGLKRLAKEGKIPDRLLVKESAPFVPAVFIAYIALNITGDVIWFWL